MAQHLQGILRPGRSRDKLRGNPAGYEPAVQTAVLLRRRLRKKMQDAQAASGHAQCSAHRVKSPALSSGLQTTDV